MVNRLLSSLILLQVIVINLFGMEKCEVVSSDKNLPMARRQSSEFLHLPQEIQQVVLRFYAEKTDNHEDFIARIKLLRLVCKDFKGRIDNSIIFAKWMHQHFEKLSKDFFLSQELKYPKFELNIAPKSVGTVFELGKLNANLKSFNWLKSNMEPIKKVFIEGHDFDEYLGQIVHLKDIRALEILFLNYADLILKNKWWQFRMFDAALHDNNFEILKLLLEKGFDINNQCSHYNYSFLHCLARGWDNPESQAKMKFLLDHGANPNLPDEIGETPLMFAVRSKMTGLVQILLNTEGIDVNKRSTKWGATALLTAIFNGHKELAKLLLDSSANVNISNFDNETPLICASNKSDIELLGCLLKKGADINAQDPKGDTVLHKNIKELNRHKLYTDEKRLEMIALLVNNPDINLSLANFAGKTAFDCLKEHYLEYDCFDHGDNLKTAVKIFEQAVENKKNQK